MTRARDIADRNVDSTTIDGVDSTQLLRSDVADTKTAGDLSFADSVKAQFGAGNDLQLYHDSNNSYIKDAGTGNLYINATELRLGNADNSKDYLLANDAGAVTITHNGISRLATTSTGIDVTGTVTMDGGSTSADFSFGDNDKALFGAGNDLQIYHDGSHSYVQDAGSGDLILQAGNDLILRATNGTDEYLRANEGLGVQIFYNGDQKFLTTSTGVSVTGTVTATSFSGDGSSLTGISSVGGATGVDFNDTVSARFGTGNDLQIFHNGSNSFVTETGTGKLYVGGSTVQLTNGAVTATYAKFNSGGSSELYYNNSKKLETTNTGISVTGTVTATSFSGDGSSLTGISSVGGATGVSFNDSVKAQFGAGNDLQIYHDGSNSYIREAGTGNLLIQGASALVLENPDGTNYLHAAAGGAVTLYNNGSAKLATTSSGVDVTGQIDVNSAGRIDSSGRVKGAHGTVGAPSFSFLNDPDNGMFRPTTNTLGFATAGAERFRVESGGNLNFNVEGSNNFRSGIDLRQGSAKMWANWNGSSTVADSYNLTSITDSGTGNYNLNINNDMNSANYSAGGLTQIDALVAYRVSYGADGLISIKRGYSGAMATGSLRVGTGSGNTTLVDNTEACVQTYGDLA